MSASPSASAPRKPADPGMGFVTFVSFIAFLMAINAMSMDIMLPALPAIGDSFGITEDNQRQWVVVAYLLGMGPCQLIYGPMADRFGRKPVLLVGLVIYVVFALLATLATSFILLIAARALMGAGAASIRVLAITIVRDCYVGRTMARVMSFAFMVFLAAPMIAPALGTAISGLGQWRWIFAVLAAYGLIITLWGGLKLKETQHPEDRRDLSFRRVTEAFRIALTTRMAVGYMMAQAISFGALFAFVASSQQIYFDTLGAEGFTFAINFALIAVGMLFAQLLNSTIVERVGTRRVSHSALFAFIVVSLAHVAVAATGRETLVTFTVLQSLALFTFGLMGPNFGAMAMTPLGHIAGTGSAVQGFVTTTSGALIGFTIGQQFDGTSLPYTIGATICGVVTLGVVLLTEKGRLFHPVQEGEQ